MLNWVTFRTAWPSVTSHRQIFTARRQSSGKVILLFVSVQGYLYRALAPPLYRTPALAPPPEQGSMTSKFCFWTSWFATYLPGWTSWNFRNISEILQHFFTWSDSGSDSNRVTFQWVYIWVMVLNWVSKSRISQVFGYLSERLWIFEYISV